MNSWVCASTPTVTRICTRWRLSSSRAMWATRTISWKESSTIRPTPASTARRISAYVLLFPWKAMRSGESPADSAVASSPPEHTSRLSPSSSSQRTTARERKAFAGVEDVGVVPEGGAPGARPGPEVGLVEDVGRRADLGGERVDVNAADGDDTVRVPGDGLGPHLGVEGVGVGGRGCACYGAPFGKDVGVPGPGGMCGTTHGLLSSS